MAGTLALDVDRLRSCSVEMIMIFWKRPTARDDSFPGMKRRVVLGGLTRTEFASAGKAFVRTEGCVS